MHLNRRLLLIIIKIRKKWPCLLCFKEEVTLTIIFVHLRLKRKWLISYWTPGQMINWILQLTPTLFTNNLPDGIREKVSPIFRRLWIKWTNNVFIMKLLSHRVTPIILLLFWGQSLFNLYRIKTIWQAEGSSHQTEITHSKFTFACFAGKKKWVSPIHFSAESKQGSF